MGVKSLLLRLSTVVSPLLWLPSLSTWLFLLSAHSSRLAQKQSRVQAFLFMTYSCHHRGFMHSRSRQITHPGCRRPCFVSSCHLRGCELSHPAPGSQSQQPDGNASRLRRARGLTCLLSSTHCCTETRLRTVGPKTMSQGTGWGRTVLSC